MSWLCVFAGVKNYTTKQRLVYFLEIHQRFPELLVCLLQSCVNLPARCVCWKHFKNAHTPPTSVSHLCVFPEYLSFSWAAQRTWGFSLVLCEYHLETPLGTTSLFPWQTLPGGAFKDAWRVTWQSVYCVRFLQIDSLNQSPRVIWVS